MCSSLWQEFWDNKKYVETYLSCPYNLLQEAFANYNSRESRRTREDKRFLENQPIPSPCVRASISDRTYASLHSVLLAMTTVHPNMHPTRTVCINDTDMLGHFYISGFGGGLGDSTSLQSGFGGESPKSFFL